MIELQGPSIVALVNSADLQRLQLCHRLTRWGYAPILFSNSAALLAAMGRGQRFDLLLLADGNPQTWSCVSEITRVLGVPAMLLSDTLNWMTRTASAQRFQAPPLFDFALLDVEDLELDIRIQALLQRARDLQPPRKGGRVEVGNYVFFEDARRVTHCGDEIRMQPRQFSLALEVFRNLGAVVSRESLWNLLWGRPAPRDGIRSLDVCVANVRRKLDLRASNGFTLHAVYGRGYQLREAVLEGSTPTVSAWHERATPSPVRLQVRQPSAAA